nr:MAG TPA: hypothetical protein [Caudoviricetes sp.]DAV42005.1 MAG TPA: hypothetical protein [Caudoviricetes sp.]
MIVLIHTISVLIHTIPIAISHILSIFNKEVLYVCCH